MKKTASKRAGGGEERPLFGPVRRPVAPPGHPLSRARPEESGRPAERRTKHGRQPGERDR